MQQSRNGEEQVARNEQPRNVRLGPMLSKERFLGDVGATLIKMNIESASPIRKMRLYDSIVACQDDAAEFFDSIGQKQICSNGASYRSGLFTGAHPGR